MRAVLSVLVAACGSPPSALNPPPPPPSPPLVAHPPTLDGLADEPAWQLDALHATIASPATEVRLLRDAQNLYVFVEPLALPAGTITITAGSAAPRTLASSAPTYELAIPLGEVGASPVSTTIARCTPAPSTCGDVALSLWPAP